MLAFKLEGDILTVTESILGFHSTRTREIKTDIHKWHRFQTAEYTTAVEKESREWTAKHYLPKVGIFDTPVCSLPGGTPLGVRVRMDGAHGGWQALFDGLPIQLGDIPTTYRNLVKATARCVCYEKGLYTFAPPAVSTEHWTQDHWMDYVKFNYEF